ncbi:MAG: isoprenoid biosynthesis glyoxalase ElbB [Desulfuromonadales bacterium]|nr:isoprenoid biosynthesis glyoxalase ElbB [Desulfuromonadales bacterium]
MKRRIGVILSGCGVYDGSEIHEAVITLLAIEKNGAEYVCISTDNSLDEVDHLTVTPTGQKRNVLRESARIARGAIKDIKTVKADEFDALILPGGFGAAKNLCDFASKGASATVHPEVERLIKEFVNAGKPIGVFCIAPVVTALVLGKEHNPKLTIGNDPETAAAINATGSVHIECSAENFVLDGKNKIVSTPAYMLATNISQVSAGISRAVDAIITLCR